MIFKKYIILPLACFLVGTPAYSQTEIELENIVEDFKVENKLLREETSGQEDEGDYSCSEFVKANDRNATREQLENCVEDTCTKGSNAQANPPRSASSTSFKNSDKSAKASAIRGFLQGQGISDSDIDGMCTGDCDSGECKLHALREAPNEGESGGVTVSSTHELRKVSAGGGKHKYTLSRGNSGTTTTPIKTFIPKNEDCSCL